MEGGEEMPVMDPNCGHCGRPIEEDDETAVECRCGKFIHEDCMADHLKECTA